jgi:hypothetical protein
MAFPLGRLGLHLWLNPAFSEAQAIEYASLAILSASPASGATGELLLRQTTVPIR